MKALTETKEEKSLEYEVAIERIDTNSINELVEKLEKFISAHPDKYIQFISAGIILKSERVSDC